jgi:hypothetical protein
MTNLGNLLRLVTRRPCSRFSLSKAKPCAHTLKDNQLS